MVMREVLTLLQHLHMHLNYLFHYIIFHLVPYICHACRRVFFAGTFLSTVDWCNTEKKALQPNESRFCFCLWGTHLGSSFVYCMFFLLHIFGFTTLYYIVLYISPRKRARNIGFCVFFCFASRCICTPKAIRRRLARPPPAARTLSPAQRSSSG